MELQEQLTKLIMARILLGPTLSNLGLSGQVFQVSSGVVGQGTHLHVKDTVTNLMDSVLSPEEVVKKEEEKKDEKEEKKDEKEDIVGEDKNLDAQGSEDVVFTEVKEKEAKKDEKEDKKDENKEFVGEDKNLDAQGTFFTKMKSFLFPKNYDVEKEKVVFTEVAKKDEKEEKSDETKENEDDDEPRG